MIELNIQVFGADVVGTSSSGSLIIDSEFKW